MNHAGFDPNRLGGFDPNPLGGFDPNRLGTALRQMAEDLATERRRVLLLQRQVTALEAQLAALGHTSMSPAPPSLIAARQTVIQGG